ncbi:MAG TPA: DUF502 domain-containing protein [Natrialbaceae archaeon]|nr:DUF502 domain-containing protein [Natrialbaceae archaeon]
MSEWKRDFASGLVIVVPILVSLYVIFWLYGFVAQLTPTRLVPPEQFEWFMYQEAAAELARVFVTLATFVVVVFAAGYLMRTALGDIFEKAIDDVANRVPGLRVVYNASKMAAETALGGASELQTPVKLEVWDGLRMTAFKTGKTTDDGRDVLFLPTAPNITTGFVIEVKPDEYTETDEKVEDALTRILSAGFGDADKFGSQGIPIEVVESEDD